MKKKVFSLDTETDGLWGNPFAIAAIIYEDEQETARFVARLPDSFVTNDWVKENVLPAISNLPVTHTDYKSMLLDFAGFYMSHKDGAECICHMGYIVEAYLFRELYLNRFIGEYDAPYPLFDISGNLQVAGENPTSVDDYAKKYSLEIADYGTTHNPLYDCEVAAKVYFHMEMSRILKDSF